MAKQLLIALAAIAVIPMLHAQGRAPQNESIRQDDLRADLFFLAGDSMRGRLTDTEENRATADFIRSRYDNNSSNLLRRSDQWPFLQRGVPAMGFITGLHPDYHTPYDRPEKINYVKMEKIARLVHQVGWDIANSDARPKVPASRSITP